MTPLIAVEPAIVDIDARAIEDLRRRIRTARIAHIPLPGRWTYGTGKEVVHELLELWAQFDVEALVRSLNAIPQVDVTVDGLRVRAFHVRGERDDALPIVLTHGWPSTVLEPLALADRLARPSAHAADPTTASTSSCRRCRDSPSRRRRRRSTTTRPPASRISGRT